MPRFVRSSGDAGATPPARGVVIDSLKGERVTQLRTTLTELARLDRERARAERRIRKKPLEL